jgi:peroxiredoxin
MRTPIRFALLAVAMTVTPGVARPPAKTDEPKLKVGDPAPPLTVAKWHQGPEVKAFEKGKVYVIVFWEADNSNPTSALREVNALKAEHKDVIPVAVGSAPEKETKERYTTREAEGKVVTSGRPKFAFAFANDPDKATHKAYGVSESPSVYVIGKDGNIAFVHPQVSQVGPSRTDLLAEVLPKVLDGSWKGRTDAEALAEVEKEYQKAMNFGTKRRALGPDFEKLDPTKRREETSKLAVESLKAADEFLKAHPSFAGHSRTHFYRAMVAVASGQKGVAAKAVDALIADGLARGTIVGMVTVARITGEASFEGELSPDVGADQLVGTILDAVLKAPGEGVDVAENIDYLLKACVFTGRSEKALAFMERGMAEIEPRFPAEQFAEMKKRARQDFEKAVRRMQEELEGRKKE